MAADKQNAQVFHSKNTHILYDSALLGEISGDNLFEPKTADTSSGQRSDAPAQGRGQAVFFKFGELALVLKHYQRGGLVARFLHDRYFGFDLEKTRAYREWRLLSLLQQLQLPAPVPVAARVIRSGFFYTADMLMLQIELSTTLADCCLRGALSEDQWRSIGQCIRLFHDKNVYHADLNAGNILLDKTNKVYLIDFDKGGIRHMNGSWKVSNLDRLQRSLQKFDSLYTTFYYSPENWSWLLDGYNQ